MTENRTPNDIDALLTTGEVAELLRVNRSTLSRWRSWRSGSARDLVVPHRPPLPAGRRGGLVAAGGSVTIRRERGRFRAILKSGRTYVGGRTFDTRREAQAWLNREQASLAGGVDPRAGKAQVRTLLPVWLEERKHAVAAKTYVADAALPRLVPTFLGALSVGAVTDREVTRALVALSRSGLAISSVHRFRDSLSSFFAWAVRERMIVANPVLASRVPKSSAPRTEMFPFSEADLERVYARAVGRDQRLADILLVDAWTGLRWSELRAIRVRDFVQVPMPVLVVQRAEPEGVRVKSTKSGRSQAGSGC